MASFRFSLCVAVSALIFASTQAAAADTLDCRASPSDNVRTIDTTLAGVPALLRIPKTIRRSPIVLWHGFGPPASEAALMAALPLDDVPAVKIYLGLPLFGARKPAGGVDELVRRQKEDFASLIFEPVVIGAANELPAVVEALRERGCLRGDESIGLFGFSGGGAAALLALAERKVRVGDAVVVNASTGLSASIRAYERATKQPFAWTESARRIAALSDAVDRAKDIAVDNPPLLIVQGADDATLPSDDAVALRDALSPFYSRHRDRLQLALEHDMAHDWTQADSADVVGKRVADWFNRVAAIASSKHD